jgi:hypothetical protein
MRRPLLAALGLLCCIACDDAQAPARRQRGLARGEEVPKGPIVTPPPTPTPAPAPARPRSSLPSPFAKANDPGALKKPAAPTAPAAPDVSAAPPVAAAAPAAPARDLSAELTSVLGQPLTCLDVEAVVRAGGRVNVSVTAHVVPSGRITRATVEAPGQPASALRCFEQRATSGALTGPIVGAPTQVTATLPVEIVATQR